MNEIVTVIKALHKDGKSARAISTELYDRGLKTKFGKFLTPDSVEAFLRHGDAEPAKPPRVFPKARSKAMCEERPQASGTLAPALDEEAKACSLRDPLKAMEEAAYEDAEGEADTAPTSGKNAPPYYDKPYRGRSLKEWPIHTDFRPHETTAEERGRWD